MHKTEVCVLLKSSCLICSTACWLIKRVASDVWEYSTKINDNRKMSVWGS